MSIRKKRKLSGKWHEIGKKYLEGKSLNGIALEYNCCSVAILNVLKKIGIARRSCVLPVGENNPRRCFSDKQEICICEEYKNGLTGKQLSEKYNTNPSLISKMLKRHGYKSRGLNCTGIYSSRWKGGVSYDTKGHRRLYKPEYSKNIGGLIAEHRYIMEMHLGRRLTDKEVVHHINEIPDDNRIENLKIMSASEHSTLHNTKKRGII